MERVFNIAGPCDAVRHYMLPPLARLPQVEALIDEGLYFVIHAPRQTGKTTFLRALAARLATGGRYAAVYASCESAQAAGGDVERAVQAVCRSIEQRSRSLSPAQRPGSIDELAHVEGENRLLVWLTGWAKTCPLPIVLFLDEIDALLDASLIAVLRQLRAGYADRPNAFPHAIALVGLRDVRDYRASLRPDVNTLGTASPFNIKSDSLLMPNFDRDDVLALLALHTEDTGRAAAGWGRRTAGRRRGSDHPDLEVVGVCCESSRRPRRNRLVHRRPASHVNPCRDRHARTSLNIGVVIGR